MVKQGMFVISLDFELHWGSIDKQLLTEEVKKHLQTTKKVLPSILDLFQENQIHATWAVVGMLFNQSAQEWILNKPKHSTQFYTSFDRHYKIENFKNFILNLDAEYFFAPALISKINQTNGQEIGSHSYGHFCYHELGSNIEEFKQDLIAAKSIASSKGIELHSLVFPRNQYNKDCLQICNDLEISIVRLNPLSWYWNGDSRFSIAGKIFRTLDNFNITDTSKVYRLEKILEENPSPPYRLRASRILKPWKKHSFLLNRLKIERIKREMTFAAQSKSYYHLWWHPENFGEHPVECMKELTDIVNHFNTLKNKYGFASFNMKEAANYFTSLH
jgi:peptidoglycan/xylan/chitin deacetylase (PgdA/CDA1 family)